MKTKAWYVIRRTLVGLLLPWTLIGLIPVTETRATTVFFMIWTAVWLASIVLTIATLIQRRFREVVLAPLWLVKNVGIGLAFTGLVVFTIGITLPVLFGPGFIFVLLGVIAAPFLGAAWLYQRLSEPKSKSAAKAQRGHGRVPHQTMRQPKPTVPRARAESAQSSSRKRISPRLGGIGVRARRLLRLWRSASVLPMPEDLDVSRPLPDWRPGRQGERDPARIDVLIEQLRSIWSEHPDVRLGQLVVNLCDPNPNDLFYIEDHVVSAKIFEFRRTGRWPAANDSS